MGADGAGDRDALVLFAAARLRIGARRLRALARGDGDAVRDFVQRDSALRLAEARRDARADLAALRACGARLVTLAGADYPAALLELASPPAFLSVRGTFPQGGIAVVGTREPSAAAERFAYAFARSAGTPIVSGLARGIDAAAHRGALDAGTAQVAYVGSGIARTFPPEHGGLADEIVAAGGAIASERLPSEGVTRWSLVQRDRLQAAHARAVVLVESELDGGAMHTMRFARMLGRPCFAVDFDAEGNRFASAHGTPLLPPDAALAVRLVRSAITAR